MIRNLVPLVLLATLTPSSLLQYQSTSTQNTQYFTTVQAVQDFPDVIQGKTSDKTFDDLWTNAPATRWKSGKTKAAERPSHLPRPKGSWMSDQSSGDEYEQESEEEEEAEEAEEEAEEEDSQQSGHSSHHHNHNHKQHQSSHASSSRNSDASDDTTLNQHGGQSKFHPHAADYKHQHQEPHGSHSRKSKEFTTRSTSSESQGSHDKIKSHHTPPSSGGPRTRRSLSSNHQPTKQEEMHYYKTLYAIKQQMDQQRGHPGIPEYHQGPWSFQNLKWTKENFKEDHDAYLSKLKLAQTPPSSFTHEHDFKYKHLTSETPEQIMEHHQHAKQLNAIITKQAPIRKEINNQLETIEKLRQMHEERPHNKKIHQQFKQANVDLEQLQSRSVALHDLLDMQSRLDHLKHIIKHGSQIDQYKQNLQPHLSTYHQKLNNINSKKNLLYAQNSYFPQHDDELLKYTPNQLAELKRHDRDKYEEVQSNIKIYKRRQAAARRDFHRKVGESIHPDWLAHKIDLEESEANRELRINAPQYQHLREYMHAKQGLENHTKFAYKPTSSATTHSEHGIAHVSSQEEQAVRQEEQNDKKVAKEEADAATEDQLVAQQSHQEHQKPPQKTHSQILDSMPVFTSKKEKRNQTPARRRIMVNGMPKFV